MLPNNWIDNSLPFLHYLDTWLEELPDVPLRSVVSSPETTAVLSVDVIKGFCSIGPLSSPRVGTIVEPVVDILKRSWDLGVRSIVLTQDSHEPDAVEFGQFAPHCVRGTAEAETEEKIRELPFFKELQIFPKNSIHSGMSEGFNQWLESHPELQTFIVLGDCTDLCTYQLAMHVRLQANERQLQRRVILPANAVDTYHLSVETADEIGILPHDADLLHAVFLYHMNLNGIEIFSKLT